MAAGIFCIYSGEVRVYSGLGSAAEQLIHIASPGEIVGFNSIAGGAFLNSALAATDTQICKIPLADIQQLLRLLAATAEKILNNKV